jgi:hypothetical protein
MPDTPKPLGRLPSPPDPRDYGIMSLLGDVADAIVLPESLTVGYAPYLGRFNQQENSCVGHTGALTKIIQERKNLHRYYPIEPLWLWDEAKKIDGIGSPGADRGTFIRSMLDVLKDKGATLSRTDQTAEARFKIAAYYRCTSVYQVKLAMYQFGAICFGSEWYDSWFTPRPDGVLPEPDNAAGGHAFTGIGYSNAKACPDGSKGAFKCANSWGEAWGLKGDFWLPYTMFGDGKPADEAWKPVDSTV